MDLDTPKVMGILNVTPDSFYSESRTLSEDTVRAKIDQLISEGADIIDVGGCSTRPGFNTPPLEIELERVNLGCRLIRERSETIPLSVDTFRFEVAKETIDKWDVNIINDISGGADPAMWELIASEKISYVLTHNNFGDTSNNYHDVTAEVITELAKKINELHRLGVNDVIIDPGFGFAKSLEENFRIFDELNEFARMGLPLLVGISRKSMIHKTLDCSPEESLTGTIALNAIALEKGADILRVHDVKEAVETVKLFNRLKQAAK